MTAVHEAVKFECPHCKSTVEVEATSVGEVVSCPSPECGLPFEASAPRGHALDPSAQRTPKREGEQRLVADENLETTLHVTHPAMFRRRPFSFIGLCGAMLLGVVGAIGSFVGLATAVLAPVTLLWISVLVAVGSAGTLLWWWIDVISETLTITSERTVHREGLLSKKTTEVLHDDVRNLQLDQTFVERLLGVGDIAISSSGQDDLEIVARAMPRPDEIVATIRKYQSSG
jgi:hypothetical protein